MTPSRLTETHRSLVLDASVVLNLLGSTRLKDVLRCLGRHVLIEDTALAEVRINPVGGGSALDPLEALRSEGLLAFAALSDPARLSFLDMTGAEPPHDLDDGEAATIALAEYEFCYPCGR